MNRRDFTRHLRANDCLVVHDGRTHTLWRGPAGVVTVPWIDELPTPLVEAVCGILGVSVPVGPPTTQGGSNPPG